jgi:hypothetical protein
MHDNTTEIPSTTGSDRSKVGELEQILNRHRQPCNDTIPEFEFVSIFSAFIVSTTKRMIRKRRLGSIESLPKHDILKRRQIAVSLNT